MRGPGAPRFEQEQTEPTEWNISIASVYSVDSLQVGSGKKQYPVLILHLMALQFELHCQLRLVNRLKHSRTFILVYCTHPLITSIVIPEACVNCGWSIIWQMR